MNIRNHFPTEELQKRDAAHHLHPFTAQHDLANKGSRIITSAQGVYVYDSNGEQLLDAMAGLWCVNIGYGREELAQAAERQMRELPYYNTFFQTTHIPAIDLSEKLAKLAPSDLNHVFYAGSGSEANDTNIRIVRQYWALLGHAEKNIIISRKNAYHGSTLGGASLGGMNAMHQQGGLPIPNVQHINLSDWWAEGGELSPEEFGLARARELEQAIVEFGKERVAAFIAEPVQGAGGVIVAPDTYWPEIQRICDKYEIILIADEVICGFGRTGNWFGSQTMKIRPDIMTIAKGLSSGYQPIGGSIVSKKIAEVIGKDEFNHGYTYSSHPVAAAVALANLNIIESEGIVERVQNETGPYLAKKWATLSDHPMVGEAKIVGMMGSIALTPDKANRAKFLSPSGTVGYICRECCFANSLIMRHVGDRMIISPPLIIDKEQIDILIERAWKSLDEGMSKVKEKGLWESAPI